MDTGIYIHPPHQNDISIFRAVYTQARTKCNDRAAARTAIRSCKHAGRAWLSEISAGGALPARWSTYPKSELDKSLTEALAPYHSGGRLTHGLGHQVLPRSLAGTMPYRHHNGSLVQVLTESGGDASCLIIPTKKHRFRHGCTYLGEPSSACRIPAAALQP